MVSFFKYTLLPCVRCVATGSPHAGLASRIATIMSSDLALPFTRPKAANSTRSVDTFATGREQHILPFYSAEGRTFETKGLNTLKIRRIFTHSSHFRTPASNKLLQKQYAAAAHLFF